MGQQSLAKKRRQMEIGIYREKYILKPIFDSFNKELICCLQLTKSDDKNVQASKAVLNDFNEFDHSKIDLLSSLLRQRVESQIYRLDSVKSKEKVFSIMKSCNQIL